MSVNDNRQKGGSIMVSSLTQIKFTIEAYTVVLFKARCESEGVSMTSVIRQFMVNCQPFKSAKPKTDTRPFRKKAVQA
jgi:hypothetical protein